MDVSEQQETAGPSGENRKRKRDRSSRSSSSSSSSSRSSSSSSESNKKRSRRHRNKRSKRKNHSSRKLNQLFQEMSELRNHIMNNANPYPNNTDFEEHLSILSGVSDELYDQKDVNEQPHLDETLHNNVNETLDQDFTFDIETKLKEPTIPKTSDQFLKMFTEVQRFGTEFWSDVRYNDTQKLYNHNPGFVDLETNDEVKNYDNSRQLQHTEKAYAAITHCILKQKESLQENIRKLISWSKNTTVNSENLTEKVDELFLKGDFHKTSSDLLQLTCGHRAETVEMRRENITKHVKDPLIKAALNKIPPSESHLFNTVPFTSTLEKAGGVRKVFWPLKNDVFKSYRLSRGQGTKKASVPSRGTYGNYESGVPTHAFNNTPSRGAYQQNPYSYRNQAFNNSSYGNNKNIKRGSFHNRGSRPERGNSRGRSNATRSARDNTKRYK